MLIENAIKHNVVSSKSKLKIRITTINSTIEVANTLREKDVKEESAFIGLKNIQKRYEFLSDTPVVIEKTEDTFKVKLPLLLLE